MMRVKEIGWLMAILFLLAGCSPGQDTLIYKGADGDWSIALPKTFQKEKEDKNDLLHMDLVIFKDDAGRILNIGEIRDPHMEVSEEALKAEIALDSYLHLERTETIDVKGIGKIYGALIEDHSTARTMLYYKVRLGEKVLTFILYQKDEFTLEEEAQVKGMITTLKKLK